MCANHIGQSSQLLNKMLRCVFFLLVATAAVTAQTTPVKKCRNVKEDLFKQVVISTPKGICTKLPCELPSGKDVVAEITFLVRNEVTKITTKCNATSLGVTTEYPIPNADKGCDYLTNTFCPIEPNTEAELHFSMKILSVFPKVAVDLVFYLVDQSNKMISCFEVPAKVVK